MWASVARFILRNRLTIILVLGGITVFLGFQARKAELSYEAPNLLPVHDTTAVEYKKFKSRFGQDGAVMVLGISDSVLYTLKNFNAWYELGDRIKEVMGVKAVLSVARLQALKKMTAFKNLKTFRSYHVNLNRSRRWIVLKM